VPNVRPSDFQVLRLQHVVSCTICAKSGFGGHTVKKEHVGDGLYLYQLVVRERAAIFHWPVFGKASQ
jgi:hypothetical protein